MKIKNLLITVVVCLGFATTIIAQNGTSNLPTNGLEACYSFTGNADDEIGGGNNGVVNGAILTAGKDGVSNTAYSFDGTGNTIDFAAPFFGGNQVNEFTFHVRLKLNDISNSPNIWGKTLSWGEVNFLVNDQGGVQLVWANNISGNKYSEIITNDNIINENVWYDIIVVYQNSVGQIFIDGQSVETNLKWVAQGGNVLSTLQLEASCNFAQDVNSSKIGSRITGGNPGNYLNGIIDQFCLWDRPLTQQEIIDLYTDNTLSNDNLFEIEVVEVYPNPVKNHLNLKIHNSHIGSKYIIFNSLGKVVISGKIKSELNLIDMNNISSGLYFLRIDNNLNTTYKLIKN